MADAVYKGSTNLVHQPDAIDVTIEDGKAYTKTYVGDQTKVDAKVDEMLAAGATRVNVQMGAPAVVSAYIPYVGTSVEGTWELTPEIMEKKLESFPLWGSTSACVEVIETVNEAIARGIAATIDFNTRNVDIGNFFNAYRDLRLAGVDSYLAYTFRIKCTRVYNAVDYPNGVAFANVGRVIPYASIGVPMSAKWEQPAIWTTSYSSSGANWAALPIDQWFVYPPSIVKAGNIYRTTQEWLGAQTWSVTLYDGGTGL